MNTRTLSTPPPPDWRTRAACLGEDPELFFPIGSTGPAAVQIEDAKAVCRGCEVRGACGSWALNTGQDHGVWGGMSEDERRALNRSEATAVRLAYLPRQQASWTLDDLAELKDRGIPAHLWPGRLGTTPNALAKRLDRQGRRDLARTVERETRRAGMA